MHRFDRPGFLPVPLQQTGRFPFPNIAHHREVLHLRAVVQQSALSRANPYGDIPQRLHILVFAVLVGNKRHIRALAGHFRIVLAINFPLRFRHCLHRLAKGGAHACADSKADEALRSILPFFIA